MGYGSLNRPNAMQSARSWSGRHLRRSKSEATIFLPRALLRYENTPKKALILQRYHSLNRPLCGQSRLVSKRLAPQYLYLELCGRSVYASRRISSTDRKPHYEAPVYSACTQSSRASTSSSFILTTWSGGSRYAGLLRESSLAVAEQSF